MNKSELVEAKESASSDYFIAVNKYHPTQTKRFRKIP